MPNRMFKCRVAQEVRERPVVGSVLSPRLKAPTVGVLIKTSGNLNQLLVFIHLF